MGASDTKSVSPLATLTDSLQQGREMLSGIADVAGLESRLAALSLTQMLTLAVVSALLACSAWGLVLAAVAFALAAAGIPWLWLLPAMAILNGGLALWAWRRVMQLGSDLSFKATRELLRTLPATLTGQTPGFDPATPKETEQNDEKSPAVAP